MRLCVLQGLDEIATSSSSSSKGSSCRLRHLTRTNRDSHPPPVLSKVGDAWHDWEARGGPLRRTLLRRSQGEVEACCGRQVRHKDRQMAV